MLIYAVDLYRILRVTSNAFFFYLNYRICSCSTCLFRRVSKDQSLLRSVFWTQYIETYYSPSIFSFIKVVIKYFLSHAAFKDISGYIILTLPVLQCDKLLSSFACSILSDHGYIFPFSAPALCSQLSQLSDADIFTTD